jgi:HNH endonuclease
METTKICSRCPEGENIHPVSQFFKNSANKDGLFAYCKTCHAKAEARPERVAKRKAYKAQYHLDHAEMINARSVQWGKDHPEQMAAKNKKSKKKRLLEQVAAGERDMPRVYQNRLLTLAAGEKPCSQCGVVKPLGDFYEWTRSPDGVQSECKDCHDGRNKPIYPRDQTIIKKSCSQCGLTKVATDFYDNPYVKSGLRAECTICTHAVNDAWERANPEQRKIIANRSAKKARQDPERRRIFNQKARLWQLSHPEAVKLHGARDRRKAKGNPRRLAKMRAHKQRFFAKNPGYKRAAAHKRRALLRQATIVDTLINIWVLYERNHGVCTLCSFAVDRIVCWPDLTMATIDHRIPVTRGGAHSYSNTKLAHHYCNSLKNNQYETPELLAYIREEFARKFLNQETQLVLL